MVVDGPALIRSHVMKRRHRIAFLLAAALIVGCASSRSKNEADLSPASPLVGAWRATIDFEQGAFAAIEDLEFMYVFNAGGTMTESSNYDGAPPVPPAYGIWRETGPRQYEAKFAFYATKPPASLDAIAGGGGWFPAGHGEFIEKITLSENGQSFESVITYNGFDQAGRPTESGTRASGRGTRITF